jgi:osmotically-inducible protein OsmY
MRRLAIACWVGAIVVALGCAVRAQEGSGKKIGEKIDEAIQDVKKGVKDLSKEIQETFERTRASVDRMGIQARVYGRIHWDKALTDQSIEVKVEKNGVCTLSGAVKDTITRAKAGALANDTVGVAQVQNQLSIQETPAQSTSKRR